jgi:hypothetical protein
MHYIIGIICWSLPGLLTALVWFRRECREAGSVALGEIVFFSIAAAALGWIAGIAGLVVLIIELPCWDRKIRCGRSDR